MPRSMLRGGVAVAALLSVLSTGVTAPTAAADEQVGSAAAMFDDVPYTHPFHDAIAWLVGEGITSGSSTTTFSPSTAVTRAQMAVLLWRYRGSPPPSRPHAFDDVPEGAAYGDAVAWLDQVGLTSGIGPGRFGPGEPVTRQQMAIFLHRAMGDPILEGEIMVIPDPSAEAGFVAMPPFEDIPVGSPATVPILWLLRAGITTGTSDRTFSPSAPVTRGQMAAFLHRLPVSELRLFYAIPSDQGPPDPELLDAIRHELTITDDWFREQTDGFGLRIAVDGSGRVPITLVDLPLTTDQLSVPGEVHRQLRAALPDTMDVHLVYIDELSYPWFCGEGGNRLATIYLANCTAPSMDTVTLSGQAKIAAHEIVHAMGGVPVCAPNTDVAWSLGHVNDDPQDLMFAPPHYISDWVLDVGRDDYYGHGRTDCLDLARHPLWTR